MLDAILRLGNIVAVVDILIVAALLYFIMLMFKGTRAERMFWGLSIVILVYFVSQRAELLTVHWLLSNFLGSIVIFIIVVFQQDIRRALIQMGKPFSSRDLSRSRERLDEIVRAVASMARTRTGGIIVIEKGIDLTDFLESGVEVDAKVTKELLLTIFNTSSPLHDGAVVVRGGKLYKAGCILPLTERELQKNMGTRHRAAIGLAEETDAVIIVVSEQTGEITLAVEDDILHGLDADSLIEHLRRHFTNEGAGRRAAFPWRLWE